MKATIRKVNPKYTQDRFAVYATNPDGRWIRASRENYPDKDRAEAFIKVHLPNAQRVK